jgi:hypothetical protein
MKYLYSITFDDYFEAIARAKANGKQPGDSIEEELLQILKEKGKKSFGATELTQEELLKEYTSKGKKVLSVEIDKDGKSQYKTGKMKDE